MASIRDSILRCGLFTALVLLSLSAIVPTQSAANDEHASGTGSSQEKHDDNPSVVIADKTLVTLASAQAKPAADAYNTFGRVIAHPAAVRDINANISGQIESVLVRTGSVVKQGDAIATVTSPDFVFTQRSYLILLSNEERLAILREEGNLPNFLKSARENLKWWGMTEKQIDELASSKTIVEQITIPAPVDGVITEISVQPGDVIDAGDKTMQNFIVLGRVIARMVETERAPLLEVYAYANTMSSLRPGTTHVRFAAKQGGASVDVPITYVAPQVDGTAQMVRSIVDLKDVSHEFSIGDTLPVAVLKESAEGVWVPRAAILRQELQPVAFVLKADGSFERRSLETFESAGQWVRVGNVALTEKLVTSGKTVLEGAYRHQVGGVEPDHHHDHSH